MASMRASGRGNRQIRTYGRAAGVLTNEGGVGTHPEDKGDRVNVTTRRRSTIGVDERWPPSLANSHTERQILVGLTWCAEGVGVSLPTSLGVDDECAVGIVLP